MAPTKPPPRPAGKRKPATTLQRAVRLLARRDMSRAELAARLARGHAAPADGAMGDEAEGQGDAQGAPGHDRPSADELAGVLDRLQSLGLQSDTRFAESYVRGRQSRTGTRRLAAELRQRGVDAETVDTALAELAGSDLARARALWARRFEVAHDPRERARQMRFLAARGFDMGVIRAVVGGRADEEGPVDDDDPSAEPT